MPHIQEHKRHLNKPDEAYACDEIYREDGYLVLRYDVVRAGHIGPFAIPAGSVTIAHYRDHVGHVLWEMWGPQRELIGYCYHICEPPVIGPDSVEYLDLLLDLWFDADGRLTVLDEDELAQAAAEGKVSSEQLAFVEGQGQAVEREHPRIICDLWRPERI